MAVEVVPYSPSWPVRFAEVASQLRRILTAVPVDAIEHVGSTAVPGLTAKPILDIDTIVKHENLVAALSALAAHGYQHLGDLGLTDREALAAPDEQPARHVYVCVAGTLHLRNHLAVRAALRTNPEFRDRYGAVKLQLSSDPEMSIGPYTAAKSRVLKEPLARSDLSADEKALILRLNTEL